MSGVSSIGDYGAGVLMVVVWEGWEGTGVHTPYGADV